MKKLFVLLFTFCISFTLAACGPGIPKQEENVLQPEQTTVETESLFTDGLEANDPSEKAEVEEYLDQVIGYYFEVAELGMLWDQVRDASSTGEMDDYEAASILNDEIIPSNMELTDKISKVYPPNDQTSEINEVLIAAMENQHLAFMEVFNGIKHEDPSLIASATERLNDVRKSDRSFARMIEKLMIDYDIDPLQ